MTTVNRGGGHCSKDDLVRANFCSGDMLVPYETLFHKQK